VPSRRPHEEARDPAAEFVMQVRVETIVSFAKWTRHHLKRFDP
jgi:hypothetical protein